MTKPQTPATPAGKLSVHAAMLQVGREIGRLGIAKDRDNAQQHFKYRGIDDVLDAFNTPLLDAGLLIVPSYTLGNITVRVKDGKESGYIVRVEGTFTFHAEDGSSRVVGPFPGEAFDSLDKATTKAESVAYRTMMLLTFAVPLGPGYDPEGTGDAEPEKVSTGQPSGRAPDEDDIDPRMNMEGDPGFALGANQMQWMAAQLDAGRKTQDEALRIFRRIDASNAKAVAAWAKGQ